MADLTAMLQAAAGNVGGDYEISRSLRFNSADSAYLSRTPASASNRKTWTWSGWVKRSSLARTSEQILFACRPAAGTYTNFSLRHATSAAPNALLIQDNNGMNLITSSVYRDVSAWYHIVLAVDTTQVTASDRVKLYVNGTQVTAFSSSTYPTQNLDMQINTTNSTGIGSYLFDTNEAFDGYLADINFVDGQALTPSSFGETDETTGVWKPIRYAGTYGTNGFHLDFSDNTSTTTLGYDAAGSNDWTLNNFSVAAGAGNDSLVDSPTRYGTDTGAGGEVRGNYCTLNPLNNAATLFNGNLDSGTASGIANWLPTSGTIGVSSGKWYWEVRMNSAEYLQVGIFPITYAAVSGGYPGSASTSGYGYQSANGNKYVLGTGSAYGATFTTNDVIGVALDLDGGTLTFYKNGVSQGTAASSISGTFVPGIAVYNSTGASTVANCNFGQRPFAYTAPSGFKALCTTNLPDPTVVQGDDYFNTVLYTGNRPSTQSISGVGFQPDFVWIKGRANTWYHRLYDAVRGATKVLVSNTTDAEATASGLTSFDSDGFSVGAEPSENQPAEGFVAWNWKANGAGVSNTDGTISSTVSANTTAGISIVTYTGNGTAGATVGHGLGVAPKMIIAKTRNNLGDWPVYHVSLGNTKNLLLNTTGAETTSSSWWNNTTPSSTVITLGNNSYINGNTYTFVAYCFAEVEGFSKFGSYTGNGSSDGSFIYLGFRPKFFLLKRYDGGTESWWIYDGVRDPINILDSMLSPNQSIAETTTSAYAIDFLSNGIKIRNSNGYINGSGQSYIYAAFAENPSKTSLAR